MVRIIREMAESVRILLIEIKQKCIDAFIRLCLAFGMIGSGNRNNEKTVHVFDQKYREQEHLAKWVYQSKSVDVS